MSIFYKGKEQGYEKRDWATPVGLITLIVVASLIVYFTLMYGI